MCYKGPGEERKEMKIAWKGRTADNSKSKQKK